MARFSNVWKKYPVLFDEATRNSHFSQDFKGTSNFIKKCYEDMGCELSLSAEEVWKRRIKYVDGVTKALMQLKIDIQNDTTVCPIPAIHKLRLFRWLWPHSKNYDADLMRVVDFEAYTERALVVQVNRLKCMKQDASSACATLQKVQELNQQRELEKLDLKSTTECDELVTFDDKDVLVDMENVCDFVASWSICTYLLPSRDPTFKYAEQGFDFFDSSCSMTASEICPKSVQKCSDQVLSALKSSGDVSFKTKQALCHAQNAESAYIESVAGVLGRVDVVSEEHELIQSNAEMLRHLSEFNTSVCDAVQVAQVYVVQYESLKDTASLVTASYSEKWKKCAVADIAHLRDLHKNSKMFSSDKWVCTLIHQL